MPSALEDADRVECLGVGTAAGGHDGGRDDGSEDGVLSEPRLKFPLAQTANMDETPVWFEAAGKPTVTVSTGFVHFRICCFLLSTACPPVARPRFCCCVRLLVGLVSPSVPLPLVLVHADLIFFTTGTFQLLDI